MATISVGVIMGNRLTLTGSTLRPQSLDSKARMARGLKEKVWPLLEGGQDRTDHLQELPAASQRRRTPSWSGPTMSAR